MDAVLATFSDFKIVKGRKVAQLILEVPLEGAQAALTALGGVPQPDSAQWVGLAPVDPDAAQKPVEKHKGGKLAQRAGILCGEPSFWRYLNESGIGYSDEGVHDDAAAARVVRGLCQVKSRAEIDSHEGAARAFNDIFHSYSRWMRS